MFYFYAFGSMLSYTVQQTLLIRYARKIDGLSLAFYRNMSFVITLLPLLINAKTSDFAVMAAHWQMLALSGLCGAVYLALIYGSYAYLPAGICSSVSKAVATVAIVLFGWFLLGEVLSPLSMLLIGVIIAGCVTIGLQHRHLPHLDVRFARGVMLVMVAAIPVAYLTYALAVLSREANPLVAGYFWEITIAIACGALLIFRKIFFGKSVKKIDGRTFLMIATCSFPTLLGTGMMSMASSLGPIGIMNAISCGTLVVTSLLAWMWYHEKLSAGQWLSMLVIIAGIVGLKFV